MKVTGTETIEHSADITAEMVRRYLARRGAVVIGGRVNEWETIGYGPAGSYVIIDCGEFVSSRAAKKAVEHIAVLEGRESHLVLADIAREA